MKRLERLRDALDVVTRRPPAATATVSLKLKSPMNGSQGVSRGARMAANETRKVHREAGRTLAYGLGAFVALQNVGCVVVLLTRVSPKLFDDDNLAAAFKSVRDGIAAWWGIDDGGDNVTWLYDSEKGPPHRHEVRASLWVLGRPVASGEIDPSDYERPARTIPVPNFVTETEGFARLRVTPNVVQPGRKP